MICPLCRQYYNGVEIPKERWNNPDDEWCPQCISDEYNSYLARHQAKQIHYNKELVIIGKAEFECSGYYLEGELYDEEVVMTGREMYGILNTDTLERIGAEIIRRIETKVILKRCDEIERELPNSKDPARLRLERSELDEQLEKLEVTV
ncbi:MAG TPA: hypothetical protein ENH82_17755 [bacterium]|nr:hypothetical protein [bacterium]